MNALMNHHRIILLAGAILLCLAVAVLGTASQASAWGERGISPESGGWCGLTDDGGTIRFEVNGDRRYVQDFTFRLPGCSISLGEVSLTSRAQIKDSKYVLRSTMQTEEPDPRRAVPRRPPAPGSPRRCVVVPCRPNSAAAPRAPQPKAPALDLLVRGTFEAVDSVAGNFKLPTSGSGCSGAGCSGRIAVGYYTAWPARFGCP
jgi:hypothetical protein